MNEALYKTLPFNNYPLPVRSFAKCDLTLLKGMKRLELITNNPMKEPIVDVCEMNEEEKSNGFPWNEFFNTTQKVTNSHCGLLKMKGNKKTNLIIALFLDAEKNIFEKYGKISIRNSLNELAKSSKAQNLFQTLFSLPNVRELFYSQDRMKEIIETKFQLSPIEALLMKEKSLLSDDGYSEMVKELPFPLFPPTSQIQEARYVCMYVCVF